MLGPDPADPAQADGRRRAGGADARGRRRGPPHRPARRLFRARAASRRAFAAVDTVAARAEGRPCRRTRRGRRRARRGLSHHHGRGRGAAPRAPADARRRTSIRTCATGSSPAPCCPAPGSCRRRSSAGGFASEALALFRDVDILIAPATPCRAPPPRPEDLRPRRQGNAGAAEYRRSSPSRSRSSACRWSRRRSGPMAKGCRSACRSSPRRGARTSRLRVARALERDGVVRAPVARR